jgi:peptidoglycan/LPS O-acetylase OafA/YrhL
MTSHRYIALDALRGVAALAVLTRHMPDLTFVRWLPGSYLAVDLFFLLSGFVLHHAYRERLDSGMSAAAFLRLRYVRLAPAYLVGAALGLVAASLAGMPLLDMMIGLGLTALFLPSPPGLPPQSAYLFPLNMPAWSLFFELAANLLFAARWSRALAGALVITGIGAIALVALGLGMGTIDGGWAKINGHFGFARVAFAFFAGVAVCELWRRAPRKLSLPAPVLVLVLLGVFALQAERGQRLWIDLLAVFAIFPALIYLGAGARGGRFSGLWALLGAISYPLYILHWPMLQVLVHVQPFGDVTAHGLTGTAVLSGLCIAVAYVAERWLDRPVRKWLSQIRPADRAP